MNVRNFVNTILKRLKNVESVEQNKSVMVKLTPEEVFNICKMGATYWSNALKAETNKSIDEVCQFHVDVALGILKETDPDRFEYRN